MKTLAIAFLVASTSAVPVVDNPPAPPVPVAEYVALAGVVAAAVGVGMMSPAVYDVATGGHLSNGAAVGVFVGAGLLLAGGGAAGVAVLIDDGGAE